jgi:glycosyltransferase involved in cell wall biosynthesis
MTRFQNPPKVSVIIPCFNQGEYVDQAVDSVLKQSFQDFEIVIVNDGSTDPFTISHLQNYSRQKTTVVHTDNQGLAAARNNGIRQAKSEYILPLDADDKIGATFLEKAVAILDKHRRIGIVYCRAQLFGAWDMEWNLPEYSLDEMLINNIIFCTALFRKSDWAKVGGFDPSMVFGWEDYDFWLSLIERGKEVYRIDEILFYYRVSTDSMVRSVAKQQKVETFVRIYHKHEEFYKRHIAVWIDKLIEVNAKYYEASLYLDDKNGARQKPISMRRVDPTTKKMTFDVSETGKSRRFRFNPINTCAVIKINSIWFNTNCGENIEANYLSSNAIFTIGKLFLFAADAPWLTFEFLPDHSESRQIKKIIIHLEFIAIEKAAYHHIIQYQQEFLHDKIQTLNHLRRQFEHLIDAGLQPFSTLLLIYHKIKLNILNLVYYIFNRDYRLIKKSKLFDQRFYLIDNPDVAASGVNPLLHYLTMGYLENRNPNPFFDTALYSAQESLNREIKSNPFVAFVKTGLKNGRTPHDLLQELKAKRMDHSLKKDN